MQHLREIFKRLQNASFYLKLSKCQLMQKSIKLLGHTIENGKIKPAPEKIRRIMDWEISKTKKQLQAFIGLVNCDGAYRSGPCRQKSRVSTR
jgi:hypothetical protein